MRMLGSTFTRGLPLQRELALVNGTIPQIQIDQRLVGDSRLGSQSLEVRDRRGIETDRDRLLESGGVGDFAGRAKSRTLFSWLPPLVVAAALLLGRAAR